MFDMKVANGQENPNWGGKLVQFSWGFHFHGEREGGAQPPPHFKSIKVGMISQPYPTHTVNVGCLLGRVIEVVLRRDKIRIRGVSFQVDPKYFNFYHWNNNILPALVCVFSR